MFLKRFLEINREMVQNIIAMLKALAKPLIKFIVKPIFFASIAKIENIAPSI